jgi:hypothetical protein
LTIIHINPELKNLNQPRSGYCHTFRKCDYHQSIEHIHPSDSLEILRSDNHENYGEYCIPSNLKNMKYNGKNPSVINKKVDGCKDHNFVCKIAKSYNIDPETYFKPIFK